MAKEKQINLSKTKPAREPTVFLIDDHPMMRAGLSKFLAEAGYQVVGSSADVTAIEDVYRLTPDFVLLDLDTPSRDSISFIKQISSTLPESRIIIFSGYLSHYTVKYCYLSGAKACVSKADDSSHILAALEDEGPFYTSPTIREFFDGSRISRRSLLSLRQTQIIDRLGQGLGLAEIAKELNIGLKTVQIHKQRSIQKLGLHSLADLGRFAAAHPFIFRG